MLVLATLSACGGGGGGGGAPIVKNEAAKDDRTVGEVIPKDFAIPVVTASKLSSRQDTSYAVSMVGAPQAHQSGHTGEGVNVAVIDGEIDVDHPDLDGAFLTRNGVVLSQNVIEGHRDVRPVVHRMKSPRNGLFEPNYTATDFRNAKAKGWDYTKGISHGTHVAGIIAARDNNQGVLGVAPNAKIIPITFFNDRHTPSYRYGLSGLNNVYHFTRTQHIAHAVNFAMENHARVINNSWGYSWYADEIEIRRGGSKLFFRLPNFFLEIDPSERRRFHAKIFDTPDRQGEPPRQDHPAKQAFENAVAQGAVIVFAAGNDGWNSQTGLHKIYKTSLFDSNGNHRRWVDYRNDKHDWIRTVGRRITVSNRDNQTVNVPANIPSLESSYFLVNERVKGAWLSVVSVERHRLIATYSNGCGEAKNYCLAAPGSNVLSTFARGDGHDVALTKEKRPEKIATGDTDGGTGDGYGTYSGTSMAAPVVSGALATLMSGFPNLSGKDAVKILLCTAKELRPTLGRPKLVDECLDPAKGPEATHSNGWTPSDVYGHGMVNLVEAIEPRGPVQASNRQARAISGALAKDSRFAFSSVFGDAASRSGLSFGAFDSFNRAYSFKAPLVSRQMPVPGLDAVMNQTVAQATQMPDWSGPRMVMRWSNDVASPIGKGHQIRFTGGSSAARIGFTQSQMSSVVMPLGSLSGHDEHHRKAIWPKLSPQATDLVNGALRHEAGSGVVVGIDVTSGQLGKANSRTAAYDFVDVAASVSLRSNLGRGPMRLGLRAGRLREDGHFLGSLAEGGYELAKGSHSNYVNAEIEWQRGPWTARLHGTEISGKMDFKHNSFVDDTNIRANEFGLGLRRQNTGAGKGRLGISYKQPLAVSSGVLSQYSVRGYAKNGDYKVVNDRLDLGVVQRHEMLQLDYEAPVMPDVIWFVSASTHRNWGNFAGRDNQMLHAGVKAKF